MIELYLMIFLCVIIALFVGFVAVTIYLGYVLITHDIDNKRKEADDEQTRRSD